MTSKKRPPIAQFIVREYPPDYQIIEIVPDMYGSLTVVQVAVGSKKKMHKLFKERYGFAFSEPLPIWSEAANKV